MALRDKSYSEAPRGSALAMQLNPPQLRQPSSNLGLGLPLLIGTSTGGRSFLTARQCCF